MPLLLAACGRQGVTTQGRQVPVGASETAFIINATLPQDQVQLTDEAFLDKNKVGSGQVPITYSQFRLKTDNRFFKSDVWGWKANNYVYVLDRAPVTREWTATSGSGTAATNQAFSLQSAESIKFSLGMNCTGQVAERDAAKFISVYSGTGRQVIKPTEKDLQSLPDAVWQVGAISAVMDNNVRGAFQGRLLGDFSSRSLDEDNKNIGPIVQKAVDDITKEFAANGLTLLNCGAHGGFAYDKPEVQDAANAKFIADQQSSAKVITAQNDAQAQTITNQKNIDQAKADTTAKKTVQDQELAFDQALANELRGNPDVAAYIEAQKWNGQSPQTVVGGNSQPPFISVGGSGTPTSSTAATSTPAPSRP